MRDGEPACRDDAAGENPAHGGNWLPGRVPAPRIAGANQAPRCIASSAPNAEEGRKRIADNLSQYELDVPGATERIVPVCGELAEPRLGLSAEQFDSLAATIDAVFHNGAYVNFVYPYQILRAANVAGTKEILRLATQTKVKPLHFVSTVSVFDSPEYATAGTINEDQPLIALGSLQGGYAQSKCVAEKLVREAGRRGLPIAVYRPGRVTADADTGAESLTDYTTLLLRLCIEMKTAPSSDDRVDMTPVDYVARAVVGLALRREAMGKTFHLINPRAVPLRDVYRAIRTCGYELQEVPPDEWRTRAIQWGGRSRDESFKAFSSWLWLMGQTPPAATAPPAEAATATPPTIACEQTLRDLQPLGISCPTLNVDRLTKQVRFLERQGTPVASAAGGPASRIAGPPADRRIGAAAVYLSRNGRPRGGVHAVGPRTGRRPANVWAAGPGP